MWDLWAMMPFDIRAYMVEIWLAHKQKGRTFWNFPFVYGGL